MKKYFGKLYQRAKTLGISGLSLLLIRLLIEDKLVGWAGDTLGAVFSWVIRTPSDLLLYAGLILIIATFVLAYLDTRQGYKEIDIKYYELPWTEVQQKMGVRGVNNNFKIGLLVTNTGDYKISCGLRMMSNSYKGHQSNNEWVSNVDKPEFKLLRWDEGYEPRNGKIDISPKRGVGRILFAESNPTNLEFWFCFINNSTSVHQLLTGRYRALVQLEGEYFAKGKEISFVPLEYEIEFTYDQRRLFDVTVAKKENAVHKQNENNE